MDPLRKASLVFGMFLIGFGVFFLAILLIPGLSLGTTWPGVFFPLAAGFYMPAFLWPRQRKGLAALFIPGSICFFLGLIFIYNVRSEDWISWAYAWLLIVSGVGLGLVLTARFGDWGRVVHWVGLWMLSISIGVFGLFATLFGPPVLKIVGAGLVLLTGLLLLLSSLRRR